MPSLTVKTERDTLSLELEGRWCMGELIPVFPDGLDTNEYTEQITQVKLIDSGIVVWDSMLMLFVIQAHRYCEKHDIKLHIDALPPATKKLLHIATSVPAFVAQESSKQTGLFSISGLSKLGSGLREFLEFVGRFIKAIIKMLRGKADTRGIDVMYFVHQVGPRGLGIVTLISILVGMILAYLGLVQLRQLGAQIYVADLVAIGMTREMGPLMTGVILAGRTGAAYAAQIGTMQTNDELDAIKTLAMSTMEFLVVPRMLALVLIMPLLVIYSDVLGMLGGALVATGLDVSWTQYIVQTQGAVTLTDIFCGLLKSVFFAILIGIAGCQAGLKCGRDSTAVGQATTTAVVRAIVYLIMADAAFNVLYDQIGI